MPILIISGGIIGARFLASQHKTPTRTIPVLNGVRVETVTVHKTRDNLDIHSTGIVQPARAITLSSQVAGRVQWVAQNFKKGGFFPENAPLFSLEKNDYELALTMARAEVSRAELELATVKSRADIARQEWQSLHPQEPPTPLADYQPQLNQAKAMLKAARATVSQHQLNLTRTTLQAPFTCRISSKDMDLGQYLNPGQQVATLKGTDKAEIMVQLPPEEMTWLTLPEATQHGSLATITYNHATWQGRLIRSTGAIDPKSQMTGLIIEVDDPYNMKKRPDRTMDLGHGLFVQVTIHGREFSDLIRIPRQALRDHHTVWLAGPDDRLVIRPVEVLRKEQESVLISRGLSNGEEVITSAVSGAANGMQLNIYRDDK